MSKKNNNSIKNNSYQTDNAGPSGLRSAVRKVGQNISCNNVNGANIVSHLTSKQHTGLIDSKTSKQYVKIDDPLTFKRPSSSSNINISGPSSVSKQQSTSKQTGVLAGFSSYEQHVEVVPAGPSTSKKHYTEELAGPSGYKQQHAAGVLKVINSEDYNQHLIAEMDTNLDQPDEQTMLSMIFDRYIEVSSDDDVEEEEVECIDIKTGDDDIIQIDDDVIQIDVGGIEIADDIETNIDVDDDDDNSGTTDNDHVKLPRPTKAVSKRSVVRRQRVENKKGKGLRHFSMKVCEKVRAKVTTSYNDVADELVEEFTNPTNTTYVGAQYDQKNIRRRVYDALNVLMALNIITKERKEIRWKGLPANSLEECLQVMNKRDLYMEQAKQKLDRLYELMLHRICYEQLVERNKAREKQGSSLSEESRLRIPFMLLSTDPKTRVDVHISRDKSEYEFNFDGKFEVKDDVQLLKKMGFVEQLEKGQCTEEDLKKFKSSVTPSLHEFVERMGRGNKEFSMDDLEKFVHNCELLDASFSSSYDSPSV